MFLQARNFNGRSPIRGPRDLRQFGQGTGRNINPNPTGPRRDTFVQSGRDSKKERDRKRGNLPGPGFIPDQRSVSDRIRTNERFGNNSNSLKFGNPIIAPGDPSRGGRISTPTFRINSGAGGNNRTPNPEPLRTNPTGGGASKVTVTEAANQIDTSNLTSNSSPQKSTRNMFLLIAAGIIALFTIN